MGTYVPTKVSGPTALPLSMAEARDHLRLDTTDDDPTVAALLIAATEWFEIALDRAIAATTWRLDLPSFCGQRIELPYPPTQSVEHVKYYATGSAVLATLSSGAYELDRTQIPAAIQLADGSTWPSTDVRVDAAQITFVAGYATPADVPELVKAGIKMLLGAWHEQREANSAADLKEVPFGVQAIVQSARSYRF